MREIRLALIAAGTAALLAAGCSSQTDTQEGALGSPGTESAASGSPTTGAASSAAAQSSAPEPTSSAPTTSDSPVPSAEPSAECTPGPGEVGGLKVVAHCGPATGQFKYQGKITKVSPGTCQVSQGAWVLNLGSTVVDPKASQKKRAAIAYLGIVAGKPNPGATKAPNLAKIPAKNILVTFHGGGVADSIVVGKARVKFAADGSSGSFAGPTLKGQKVTGKFNCGQ